MVTTHLPSIKGIPRNIFEKIKAENHEGLDLCFVVDLDKDEIYPPKDSKCKFRRLPSQEGKALLNGLIILKNPRVAFGDLAMPLHPFESLLALKNSALEIFSTDTDDGTSPGNAYSFTNERILQAVDPTDDVYSYITAEADTFHCITSKVFEDEHFSVRSQLPELTMVEREAGVKWLLLNFIHDLLPDIRQAYVDLTAIYGSADKVDSHLGCNPQKLNHFAILFAAEIQRKRDRCDFVTRYVEESSNFKYFFNEHYEDRIYGNRN